MAIKICYIAGREAAYSRTHNMLKALQSAGFEVATCFPPDRSKRHQPRLVWEFLRKSRDADLVLVGFYGQLMLPFVRLLARKPILFDIYVSTYAAMVDDRAHASPDSLKAGLFWLVDCLGVRLSDHLLLETDDHIRRYARSCGVTPAKFSRLFLTSDDQVMRPREPRPADGRLRVHFHGEYAPFHGVDVILRAAKLLEHDAMDFQIIGAGITYQQARGLAAELGLTNVEFIPPVPYAELAAYMSRADVCLGIFGANKRAERELTNKVIEAIAVGKPLVTRRNDPVEELLQDGESVLLVEPNDPESLAGALRRLQSDPELRHKLGDNALRTFQERCSQRVFARELKCIIENLLSKSRS